MNLTKKQIAISLIATGLAIVIGSSFYKHHTKTALELCLEYRVAKTGTPTTYSIADPKVFDCEKLPYNEVLTSTNE